MTIMPPLKDLPELIPGSTEKLAQKKKQRLVKNNRIIQLGGCIIHCKNDLIIDEAKGQNPKSMKQ